MENPEWNFLENEYYYCSEQQFKSENSNVIFTEKCYVAIIIKDKKDRQC